MKMIKINDRFKRCDSCHYGWLRSHGGKGGKTLDYLACRHPNNVVQDKDDPTVFVSMKVGFADHCKDYKLNELLPVEPLARPRWHKHEDT